MRVLVRVRIDEALGVALMLLGATPSALMPCPGGHSDISDLVVSKVFELDREAVVASDKSLEN